MKLMDISEHMQARALCKHSSFSKEVLEELVNCLKDENATDWALPVISGNQSALPKEILEQLVNCLKDINARTRHQGF